MGGSIVDLLQALVDLIIGPMGILIMALGIASAGIAMLSGQMDRGGFGKVVFGCALIYGCAWLADTMVGGGGI